MNPTTAETKYRIASITQADIAVMVFQLVEEGKLKLRDTLDRFFPQNPPGASRARCLRLSQMSLTATA